MKTVKFEHYVFFNCRHESVEERTTASLSQQHISDILALIMIPTLFNVIHFSSLEISVIIFII